MGFMLPKLLSSGNFIIKFVNIFSIDIVEWEMFVMTALVCRLAAEYETPLTSDPPEIKFIVLSIGGGGNGASPCPSFTFLCANVAFPFSVSKSLRNPLFSSSRTSSLNATHSAVVWP